MNQTLYNNTKTRSALSWVTPTCAWLLLVTSGCEVRQPLRPATTESLDPTSTTHIALTIETGRSPAPEKPSIEPPDLEPEEQLRALTPFVVKAEASSLERARFVAEHAFDGNRFTRWASAASDKEFVMACFDRAVVISSITVRWERARSAQYAILALNPDEQWTELARCENPTGLVDSFNLLPAATATAIRISCERRATHWGNSIYEVEMMGYAQGQPPSRNLIGYFPPSDDPWERREREIAARQLAEVSRDPANSRNLSDDAFLDLLERRAFAYFWYETNPTNGLTRDRGASFDTSEDNDIASVAAVGFALSAYPIGVERGWVSRSAARERTVITLRTFANGGVRHLHGFFPHFVNIHTGKMVPDTEISTIDTALFLAGMITAMEYFRDSEISALGQRIFERVDWRKAAEGHPYFVHHGWDGALKPLSIRWGSFTEGVLIYVLALASPTHPLDVGSWNAIDRQRGSYGGYEFVVEHGFQSMFRYQYPALWYDFRGKKDSHGVDFFENAAIAALAMRQYCIDQAKHFPKSYGPDLWGLSAADGPGDYYMIFGFPPGTPYSPTDGTIVPYAIAGSMPFVPCHAMRALRKLYDDFRNTAWGKYGLTDSLNPTLDFIARDSIGIDVGTTLLGIENQRSGMVWKLFMRNRWIQTFTRRVAWEMRPLPEDAAGPVDLARACSWRLYPEENLDECPSQEDSGWIPVLVPDFWQNLEDSRAQRANNVWYETSFNLPAEKLEQWCRTSNVELRIGGIDDGDEVYLNNAKIGSTMADRLSAHIFRRYAVPVTVLRPGFNRLTIRVTNLGDKGGIWKPPIELGPRNPN